MDIRQKCTGWTYAVCTIFGHFLSVLCTAEECDELHKLTALTEEQFLTSNNYPDFYKENYLECWLLTAKEEVNQVEIECIDIDVQASTDCLLKDYLEIFDGGTDIDPTIDIWCGSANTGKAVTKGQHMLIKFQTGPADSGGRFFNGFNIRYVQVHVNDNIHQWMSSVFIALGLFFGFIFFTFFCLVIRKREEWRQKGLWPPCYSVTHRESTPRNCYSKPTYEVPTNPPLISTVSQEIPFKELASITLHMDDNSYRDTTLHSNTSTNITNTPISSSKPTETFATDTSKLLGNHTQYSHSGSPGASETNSQQKQNRRSATNTQQRGNDASSRGSISPQYAPNLLTADRSLLSAEVMVDGDRTRREHKTSEGSSKGSQASSGSKSRHLKPYRDSPRSSPSSNELRPKRQIQGYKDSLEAARSEVSLNVGSSEHSPLSDESRSRRKRSRMPYEHSPGHSKLSRESRNQKTLNVEQFPRKNLELQSSKRLRDSPHSSPLSDRSLKNMPRFLPDIPKNKQFMYTNQGTDYPSITTSTEPKLQKQNGAYRGYARDRPVLYKSRSRPHKTNLGSRNDSFSMNQTKLPNTRPTTRYPPNRSYIKDNTKKTFKKTDTLLVGGSPSSKQRILTGTSPEKLTYSRLPSDHGRPSVAAKHGFDNESFTYDDMDNTWEDINHVPPHTVYNQTQDYQGLATRKKPSRSQKRRPSNISC